MICFRSATDKDLPIIIQLAQEIWPVAYGHILLADQIEYMLQKMYNPAVLLHQLRNGHRFIIAEREKKDVGFAGFSEEDGHKKLYKLHKLYVHPQQQGKGLGRLLLNEVVAAAKRDGGARLQLNVNRHNKAKNFYQRLGFDIVNEVDLYIGNGYL